MWRDCRRAEIGGRNIVSKAPRNQRGGRGAARRMALLLAAAGLSCATLIPAAAFELFGRKFFEADNSEVAAVPDAQPYTLDVSIDGDERLQEAVRNSSALLRDAERPPPGTAGLLARARGDYGRIAAALYARGHYGGTVRITVNGQPVETLRPDVALPDPASVSVTVDPGPLFRFGEIRIEGLPDSGLTEEDREALQLDDWELTEGAEARSGAVLETEGRLVELWRQRGHPKAAVPTRDVVADHRTETVDVTLIVDPGPAAQFGAVEVTGTERMDPGFVRRMTGIAPGEPYDPDTVRLARERLQRLGVFSSIAPAEGDAIDADGLLPITFNVSERKRRLIGGGASYSTLEGASLEAYWLHRNLFGRAESLRFDASVSRIGAEALSGLNYAAATTFRKPGVLSPNTDMTLRLAGQREFVETYESRSVTAQAGLEHRFSDKLTGATAVSVERAYVEDAFGSNRYSIVSVPSTLDFDGRDDKLDPTRGFRATANAEPLFEFENGTAALVARGSLAGYFSLSGDNRTVLAARTALGSIVGGELQDIPANRRFFLGGGGSIRGYQYRSVGPRIGEEVVGGLSFWEASVEARFRVSETIGIVPFIDAGAAYEKSAPDFSEGIRVGAGLGLRYYTGLGPLRFDVAVPLNGGEDDPSIAFYVGLGQAF